MNKAKVTINIVGSKSNAEKIQKLLTKGSIVLQHIAKDFYLLKILQVYIESLAKIAEN